MSKEKYHTWKRHGLILALLFAYSCVVTCVTSFLFTLASGSCTIPETLLMLFSGIFCSYLGYFCRLQVQKRRKKIFSVGIIAATGLFLSCALMLLLFLWSGAYLVCAICAAFYFICGWVIQKSSFSRLSSTLMIFVCLGIHAAIYFLSYLVNHLMSHLFTCQFSFNTYILLIFPVILTLLLFRNQSNLDELMTYGRKHIAKNASNNRMSILFTIGTFVVILLLYFLWNPVLQLLFYVGNVIKYGISKILQWFFGMISSNVVVQDQPSELPKLMEGQENLLLKFVFIGILAIIFLVLFIKLFPGLYEGIKNWLRHLLSRLKSRFSKLGSLKKGDSEYYFDNVTDIDLSERKAVKRSLTGTQRWGKFARQYRHTKDPVEQIRLCYAYTLGLLRESSTPPLKCDTPLEILHKMLEQQTCKQKVDLSVITQIYSDVRYAELTPDKEKNDRMFSQVKQLSKQLKAK